MNQSWWRHLLIAILTNRFVKLLGSIVALFLALALLMDWIIMPIYTRHGEAVEVPNVTSMRFEEAKRTLESNGFKIERLPERFDGKSPAGYVIEQIPRPLANVKGGRSIYVAVSKGGQRIKMPSLIGLSLRNADFALARVNLKLGRVDSAYSNDPFVGKGTVLHQAVPANADVGTGTVVNITINAGNAPIDVAVPSVAGLTYDAAVELIQQAGLVIGQMMYKEVESLLPETVISQSLEANSIVKRGSKIDLELSKLPNSTDND